MIDPDPCDDLFHAGIQRLVFRHDDVVPIVALDIRRIFHKIIHALFFVKSKVSVARQILEIRVDGSADGKQPSALEAFLHICVIAVFVIEGSSVIIGLDKGLLIPFFIHGNGNALHKIIGIGAIRVLIIIEIVKYPTIYSGSQCHCSCHSQNGRFLRYHIHSSSYHSAKSQAPNSSLSFCSITSRGASFPVHKVKFLAP